MEKRPKITIELNNADRIVEWLSWTLLIGIWVFASYGYLNLPEIIPVHFDAYGKPDDYGNKWSIFLLPFFSLFIVIGLTLLNRYPHIFNYPVKITEQNAKKQYIAATRLIRWLKIGILIMFGAILYQIHASAIEHSAGNAGLLLPVILLCTFIPMVIYFIVAFKLNKS